MDNKTLILSMAPASGRSVYTTCPFCRSHNKFSITNSGGAILWHCFRNSCGRKGKFYTNRTLADIKHTISTAVPEQKKFSVPEHFLPVTRSEKAVKWLERNHAMDAYVKGLADVRFDPRLDRAVFLVYDEGTIVDAVGRLLEKSDAPKWWRYGNSAAPFVIPRKEPTFVVEDCASACAVASAGYTGFALLGTNLTSVSLSKLIGKKVVIALDKDASRKAVNFTRHLSWYADVETLFLQEDLKYLDPEEIKEFLHANGCAEKETDC